jgi:dTDP-4-dehydrorhamnose reductase
MSAVLVIGASGFLGRHLMSCCPRIEKVGTYFLHGAAGLTFLDLQNSRQIHETIKRASPSTVIYAAGLTDVDACERNPELAWQLNAHAAAEVAASSAVRVVYISTDYVFDGSQGLYREKDEATPLNTYGQTKFAGEQAVLAHNHLNLVVRVSGLYNEDGIKGRGFSNPLLPVAADDVRLSSPIHVDDVVSAIDSLLDSVAGGIYHVAGPDVLSRYEFWQLVSLHCPGKTTRLAHREIVAARPRDTSLSTQRMQSLGWKPRSVCQGLPPIESISAGKAGSPLTERQGSITCEGLLIDCVGGLLTRRTWLPENGTIVEIDNACADVLVGEEFWRTCTQSFGFEESDFLDLQEQVSFRYTPNPPVWAHLRRWRARYRLALVNNGPSATFRRWVQKYGLDQIFDVLANSEELGVRKPDPEFFGRVTNMLGVCPDRCVLIDDDPGNIDGAQRYGLRTVQTKELCNYPLSIHEWDHTAIKELISGVEPHA